MANNNVLISILFVSVLLFGGCVSGSSTANQSNKSVSTDVVVKKCGPGLFTVDNAELQKSFKDAYTAELACKKACQDQDAEYQRQDGTDTGMGYILIQCNCWCQ